jgi:hypothetical protein
MAGVSARSTIAMKNFWLTVGVVIAAAALSFGAFYAMNDEPAVRHAAREGDAMAWLRAEFHLDDAQFAAIKKLHDDYGAVCARHCTQIMAAKKRIAELGTRNPEQTKAAEMEEANLERMCLDSMTDHFRQVAALMPADQGERYLAIVLPRIRNYTHEGTPTVQVRP